MGKVGNPRVIDRDGRLADLARLELAHEFDLVDPVGTGRGTAVFAAHERNGGADVMLKVIARGELRLDADALFRAALAAQTTFDHPHLVPVLRYGATDSLFWFTRANIRATPLADVLAQGTRLDERRVRHIATQAANALDYLHRRGATHGALSTTNVLLDPAGWVHLCDPAIALTRDPRRSLSMPPAELEGPVTDQQALASVLHECLVGEPPDLGLASLTRAGVSPAISRALARALSPEPADRFPRLADFIGALESVQAPRQTPTGPTSTRPTPTRRTPAQGVPARGGRRPSSEGVLFVPDWEAPPASGRVRALRFTLAVLAVAAIGALAVPYARSLARPPETIRVAPEPPTAAPVAPAASPATAPAQRTDARRRAAPPPPVAPPPAPAILFINSVPWGRVRIDGEAIGNTPRVNVSVPSGARTLRVEREGYVPFERRLDLAPGDTVRLTDIVLFERPR